MLGRVKSGVLSLVRQGSRQVIWPPEKIGVGNLFYVWLQAHVRREAGNDVVVRTSAASEPWKTWFPELFDELIVDADHVRFTDRREVGLYYQEFGADYSIQDIEAFIDAYILRPGSRFARLVAESARPGRLVLNVRRGDYYTVEKFRQLYAFDIVAYVRAAVAVSAQHAPLNEILVVSDNVDWCKSELGFLADHAQVSYVEPGLGPAEHLAILGSAERLILANSTFSYWGGYVSNRFHAEDSNVSTADVVVPRFHSRLMPDPSSYHLDPRWTVIDDLDGGWPLPA